MQRAVHLIWRPYRFDCTTAFFKVVVSRAFFKSRHTDIPFELADHVTVEFVCDAAKGPCIDLTESKTTIFKSSRSTYATLQAVLT